MWFEELKWWTLLLVLSFVIGLFSAWAGVQIGLYP